MLRFDHPMLPSTGGAAAGDGRSGEGCAEYGSGGTVGGYGSYGNVGVWIRSTDLEVELRS